MIENDLRQERITELLLMNSRFWNQKEHVERLNDKLKSENLDLENELHELNEAHTVACEANDSYIGLVRRQENANKRLIATLNEAVNRIMRQTIAQKSHRERNIELREMCKDIMRIMEIAHDEYPFEDIPF